MLISSINYQSNIQKNHYQSFKAKEIAAKSMAERAVDMAMGVVKEMSEAKSWTKKMPEGKTFKQRRSEGQALSAILTNSLIIPKMIQSQYIMPILANKSAEESAKIFEDFDIFINGNEKKIKARLDELSKEATITKDNKYVMGLIREAFRNNQKSEAINIIIDTLGDDIVFTRAADIEDPDKSAVEDNKNREVINRPEYYNALTNVLKKIPFAKPTEEEMSPFEATFEHNKNPEVIKTLIDRYGIQASIKRAKRNMLNAAEIAFIYNDNPEVIKVIVGKISEFCNRYNEDHRSYYYDYSKLTRGTYSSRNFSTTCNCLAYNKNHNVLYAVINSDILDTCGLIASALSTTLGVTDDPEIIPEIITNGGQKYIKNIDEWLKNRLDAILKNNTNLEVLAKLIKIVGAETLMNSKIDYIQKIIEYNKNPDIKTWIADIFGNKAGLLSDAFRIKMQGKNVQKDTEYQTDDFQIRELADEEFEALKKKYSKDIGYICIDHCQFGIYGEHLNKWNVQLIDYAFKQLDKYNDYSSKNLYKEFIKIESDKDDDLYSHHIKTECGARVALRMLKNPWPFYNPDGYDDAFDCAMFINRIGAKATNKEIAIFQTNLLDELEDNYNRGIRCSSEEGYEGIRILLENLAG